MINETQKQMLRTLATALRTPHPVISTYFTSTSKPDGSLHIAPRDEGFSLNMLEGWDKLTVEDLTQFVAIGIFNLEQRTSRSGANFTLDGDFVRLLVANDFQFMGARHRRYIPRNSAFYADLSEAEHAAIHELAKQLDCLPVDLVRAALSDYAQKQGKQIDLRIS